MKTAQRTLFAAILPTIFSDLSYGAQDVTIIYTNDSRSCGFLKYRMSRRKTRHWWLANISTLVKQEKAKNKATFILMLETISPGHISVA